VNVGGVRSILMTSLLEASMFPLASTDRAVIVVCPSAETVIGAVGGDLGSEPRAVDDRGVVGHRAGHAELRPRGVHRQPVVRRPRSSAPASWAA
jgi:hypothetical protein